MSREDTMQRYIEMAQVTAKDFIKLLISNCPVLLSEKDKAYMYNDMENNIRLYFDDALEEAKEADEPGSYSHQQEENDRARARGEA